jgi:hypothetical protein
VEETLKHVGAEDIYVVGGDGTQTPRSGKQIEGVGWLRNLRTPPFKVGIHLAQRWFNGSWLLPEEQGYSRALPLRWLPAFPATARRAVTEPCKEWEAAVVFLTWLKGQLAQLGRVGQQVLMVADGSFDTLKLWQRLPEGVILLARSAKNRLLHHLPPAHAHGNRRYGERAPSPQDFWGLRSGWRKLDLFIRGQTRALHYRVEGPFLRKGAPDTPLFLIIVRGQSYPQHRRHKRRDPLPLLVNALRGSDGRWTLPLPVSVLLFWVWQRWELEVCHRELKAGFGLGHKQCWNPTAALASVQWSAWVYSLLLLAGYRTWGLTHAPAVPSRWWRGSGRWSLNTLWRAFRAALWGAHVFRPLWTSSPSNWLENEALLRGLAHAVFAAARA